MRQLLSPADDTASRALVNVQTATTRVKELVTEGVSKGWGESELTAKLNSAIAAECRKIDNLGLREQTKKSLVTAARKWHYELSMTYRVLDNNLAQEAQRQPLNLNIGNLLSKPPYEKMVEFRKILDDGTSPGIPVIKDYQRSVKLAMKAMSAEPPKTYVHTGKPIPIRLRAEMAARYAAAVESLQQLIDAGVMFCWISSHPNCSPRCKDFQGRLYSLFQGTVSIGGKEYGESGTIDGIYYEPINNALAGQKGDGNGCISGYNCRHRAIEYVRGSVPPADFSEAEIKREYAVDKQQRAYENQIRQLKMEERQLRACGMTKEAAALRKQWRKLTVDYQTYSMEHDRAFYPYRCVIDETEIEGVSDGKLIDEKVHQAIDKKYGPIPITTLAGAPSKLLSEKYDLKSNQILITRKQYDVHIAKGVNTHDDIFDRVKDHLSEVIAEPDYIFDDERHKDTVIFVSQKYAVQIVIALNTADPAKSNTIITLFGCGERTLQRLLRNKKSKLLYKKEE